MNLTTKKNWKTVKLGEVATEMFSGGTPSTQSKEYYGGNIPWLRTQEVNFNYIYQTDLAITEEGFKNSSTKWVPANSVIVAMYGNSAGRVAYSTIPLTTNQACCNIVVDPKETNPKFLYFLLKREYKKLENLATGGAQQNLSVGVLRDYEIKIPESLDEQREIAGVLGCLDDKIELLRKENKTLEGMTQTLFKEWFVNFNFPNTTGKMIDSELGEIPEGWNAGTLRDICKNFDSKRIPLASDVRAKRKGIYPYYGATQIMDYIDEFLFDGTYLLLAEDASVMDERGFPVLQYVEGRFWVSNHAHVLQGRDGYSTEMLTLLMRRTPVAGIVTGAVQLKINQENLFSLEVVVPPKEIADIFNQTIQPQFQKLKNNEKEIQTLSKLRDDLLNKIFNV